MIKIWHISDTHTYHGLLDIPKDIDIVIFSGDCSNPRNPIINKDEVLNFISWFKSLNIKYKIFVAGNHDSSIESRHIKKDNFTENGIIYLENSSVEVEGLNIWGSPYTPLFGEWSFMRARNKINKIWDTIPDNTNIVVVHGPPKGILDSSYSREGVLEACGCSALKKKLLKLEPKLCLFGHIHNFEDIINAGTLKLSKYRTIFSNGSVVTDREFGRLSSNGNILEI